MAIVLGTTLASPAGAANLFNDLDSPETDLSASLPPVGNPDHDVFAFGLPDGRACVIALEGLVLRSHRSVDAGHTFGPGVTVYSGSPVLGLRVVLSADGRLFAAFAAADPLGGARLLAARSDDLGLTWTAPVVVADSTGPAPPNTRTIAIHAAAGLVAIAYSPWPSGEVWVATSADLGANWRLRRVDSLGGGSSWSLAVAIDPATGGIYVAYSQAASPNGYFLLWTARSLDGGLTFEPPVDRSPLPDSDSFGVSLAVAADGGVLLAVAYTDPLEGDFVSAFRSTDHGVTFSLALIHGLGTFYATVDLVPRLRAAAGVATVFLTYRTPGGSLAIHRSTDHGNYFELQNLLSGSTMRDRESFADPIVRTSAGNWAVAWEDTRFADSYRGPDVYVRTSTNGGLSWSAEQRVSAQSASRAEQVTSPAVAATGSDGILVAHAHTGATEVDGADVFAAVASAAGSTFGADSRIDDDLGSVAAGVSNDIAVTGDGAQAAYAAFSTTSGTRLYVIASRDKGETVAAPVLVSYGERRKVHALAATPDGRVYLVYSLNTLLLFARSDDFGVTWPTGGAVIGYAASGFAGLQALPGGRVYIAWTEGNEIYLARSSDGGASLTIADVDQNSTTGDRFPQLCAEGHEVVLVWSGKKPGATSTTVLASSSADDGQTFAPVVNLRSSTSSLSTTSVPRLACDGNSAALAIWKDSTGLRRARFDGTAWSPDAAIATPPGALEDPIPAYVDAAGATAIVTFASGSIPTSVYSLRSTNGGLDFGSPVQLDLTAPSPAALDRFARIVTDHRGHVWVTWLDTGVPGNWSLAMTRSHDAGATFAPVVRVNRETPQGALMNYHNTYPVPVGVTVPGALPGIGLFAWVGQRESSSLDALFNRDVMDEDLDGALRGVDCDDRDPAVFPGAPQQCDGKNNDCDAPGWPAVPAEELDPDGDGAPTCADCAPEDASVSRLPGDVGALNVEKNPATRISWVASGAAARYDVAGGSLDALQSGAGTAGSTCLADDLIISDWTDSRPDPHVDSGFFFVVREQNVCGNGPYGFDSSGAPRAAPAACP